MQELRLVAVSEDGTYLVLATAGRGTRFTLPVDDRLRAAVRGHFSRLGQFEIEVESPLRPKEIQARIRAGETAEEIAESAGIPVERVRWFEGPVLQEREYMAQQAQRVTVRRQGESSPGPPLGEMVEERLGRRGVDLEDIEWDSCKCEDNTWRVRLSFFDDGRPHAAEWVFDPRRRHISPLDEEAARLSSLVLEEPPTDTVTPLVPRRPAMKVVSEPRAAGEPRNDRALETRRDQAEPRRDYIIERGRMVEPSAEPPAAPQVEPAASEIHSGPDRREHGNVRGRPGFAPLPPAREIAIPPIDIDEVLRSSESSESSEGRFPSGEAPMAGEDGTDRVQRAEQPGRDEQAAQEHSTPIPPTREQVSPERAAQEQEHASRARREQEARAKAGRADEADEADQADRARPDTTTAATEPQAGADGTVEQAEAAGRAPEPESSGPAGGVVTVREAEGTREGGPDGAGSTGTEAAAARPVPEPAEHTRPNEPIEPAATASPEAKPIPAKPAASKPAGAKPAPAAPPATPPAPRARPRPDRGRRTEPGERVTQPAAVEEQPAAAAAALTGDAAAQGAPKGPQRGRRKGSARGKRASVPSWDEIMFGARRPD